jgi:hypothetical protein
MFPGNKAKHPAMATADVVENVVLEYLGTIQVLVEEPIADGPVDIDVSKAAVLPGLAHCAAGRIDSVMSINDAIKKQPNLASESGNE